MAGGRTFVVRFISDVAGAVKGIKQVSDGMGGMKTDVSSLIPSFKTVAISGAAAFGAVATSIGFAMKAAGEDQKSQVELQRQLERTFGANDALVRSTEDYIGATELRYGTSDTALRTSLGLLVRSTGDMTQSQDLLNTAQNIAASTGRDLESVSLALARASQGQFTALSKLGVPLDDATKKSKDFDAVLGKLNDQFGGAAQAEADTFGGQMARLGTVFENVKEKVGFAILNNDLFKDALDRLPDAADAAIKVLGEEGFGAALDVFLDQMGIVGAYVKFWAASVIHEYNAMAMKAANALVILSFGFVQLVPGFKDAQKEIQNNLLMTDLQMQASQMHIDDLKDAMAEQAKQTRINGAASDRLAGQAKGLGKALGDDGDGDGTGVAKAVKKATDRLKIYTDALKSSNSAQKAFTNAQKASVKAGQSLTAANQGVADAEAALNQAVSGFGADSPQARKAALELAQAQRGLERAGYNVEGSLFAIKDAEEALKKVRADPESTPQAIREAEIALAEAKLSSADAIDQQTEATDGLTKANDLLNEAVSGVSTSSDIYKELSDALTTAKENQAEAVIAVAEAIERETEAMEAFGKAIEEAGKIAGMYPIIAGKFNLTNPMAGSANAIPSTVTGNSSGYNPNGTVINNTVQAGIVASPDQVAQELANLSDRYRRLNGSSTGFF
jgi:tetratricopeptide (TPR) repeat protein